MSNQREGWKPLDIAAISLAVLSIATISDAVFNNHDGLRFIAEKVGFTPNLEGEAFSGILPFIGSLIVLFRRQIKAANL